MNWFQIGNFTDQLETIPYIVKDFEIIFNMSRIFFWIIFDPPNTYFVYFGLPVFQNGIYCFIVFWRITMLDIETA